MLIHIADIYFPASLLLFVKLYSELHIFIWVVCSYMSFFLSSQNENAVVLMRELLKISEIIVC